MLRAQSASPLRAPLVLTSPLQDKNFYLLSLIERSPAVRDAIRREPGLSRLTAEKTASLSQVAATVHAPAGSYVASLLWTPSQITEVANALRALYRSSDEVRKFTDQQLPASGVGPPATAGADLLAATWEMEAAGMNRILAAYGEGKTFPNSDIDGLAYDANSEDYREFLQQLAITTDTEDREDKEHLVFFDPALRFCLTLLETQQRDEAARLEPLEQGENAAALAHLKTVDWSRFRYAALVVPGMGPDLPGVPLAPMGRLRVEAAARAYRNGQAPFVLLSGGYVHPRQTPFCEALEMKKSLMRDFHVPEEAILIDPHARHTTTNLRNAARILYRDGFPLDKPVAIISDVFQIGYIASPGFAGRCDRELGYEPFRKLSSIDQGELQWVPDYRASLLQDPRDPLDP